MESKATRFITLVSIVACAWCAPTASAAAAGLDEVVLQVTGNITVTNSSDGKSYEFTDSDLIKLGVATVRSSSKHSSPPHEFSGPLVRDILRKVGASPNAKYVIFGSADGYVARAPVTDFIKWDVVVAHTLNGERLKPETMGPLWSNYPTDSDPVNLRNGATLAKSVWSLTKMKVQ